MKAKSKVVSLKPLSQKERRVKVVKDWRTYCNGRLYWKKNHPKWRRWQSADIAATKHSGVGWIYFTTLQAIEEHIIDCLKYPEVSFTKPKFIGAPDATEECC